MSILKDNVERYEVEAWLGDAAEDMTPEQIGELYRLAQDAGPDVDWTPLYEQVLLTD